MPDSPDLPCHFDDLDFCHLDDDIEGVTLEEVSSTHPNA